MYAIVEIAGQQFKVEKDQQLYVHRLENKEGEVVSFDNVLLIDNDGKVNVGAPAIAGASVSAKVMEHLKGDKVIVFKKKRRKGYRKKNGHRQYLTSIQIEGISEKGGAKKATAKAKPAPKQEEAAEEKPAAKKAAAKKPAAKKEAAPKKEAAAKKPAAKKAPAKKAAPKKEDSNENKKEG